MKEKIITSFKSLFANNNILSIFVISIPFLFILFNISKNLFSDLFKAHLRTFSYLYFKFCFVYNIHINKAKRFRNAFIFVNKQKILIFYFKFYSNFMLYPLECLSLFKYFRMKNGVISF